MRLRCPYCARPIRPLWLRCPVCKTRQPLWYLLTFLIAVAALALAGLILFRKAGG